ncbi:uncharacterized protein Tco025E_09295 [Trypanosoma conorhini]|uniref:Uncharacterized protein n=1 Tax=Trypanosoma conorhini TaxID=83891 RepID=A0A422MXZ6_9TRYP|nr:uncharacterized protein Tco025E_09295 [Trypanosoma conorhini]RNE98105.1 hypothetical protein Tco025E_09295 [Trypanosoma conorhini]
MRLRLHPQRASLVYLLRISIGAQSTRRRRAKVHTRVGGIEGLRGNGARQNYPRSCNLTPLSGEGLSVSGWKAGKGPRRVAVTRRRARTTADSTGYPASTQRPPAREGEPPLQQPPKRPRRQRQR